MVAAIVEKMPRANHAKANISTLLQVDLPRQCTNYETAHNSFQIKNALRKQLKKSQQKHKLLFLFNIKFHRIVLDVKQSQ